MRGLRIILGNATEERASTRALKDSQVLDALQAHHIGGTLRCHRLLYFARIVLYAPPILLALLQLHQPWRIQLFEDLRCLQKASGKLDELPPRPGSRPLDHPHQGPP
eukprot:14258658-Alexandrium_andersonii.AAC.1